jgi:hypothetical protein
MYLLRITVGAFVHKAPFLWQELSEQFIDDRCGGGCVTAVGCGSDIGRDAVGVGIGAANAVGIGVVTVGGGGAVVDGKGPLSPCTLISS